MSTATALRPAGWRRVAWPHPEWWSLGLSGAAWLVLLYRTAAPGAGPHAGNAHVGHAHAGAAAPHWPALTAGAFWWLVMVVAMMFPMVVDQIRFTAARNLWRRRHRAIAGFLLGYLSPWMVFGVAASAASGLLLTESRMGPVATVGFFAALLWQLTPAKRRALLGCHRTMPFAPGGWRADRDCLRYGCVVGSSCVVSCWALMLACVLAGHGLVAMAGVTAVGWAERNRTRPGQPVLCAVIVALALAYAAGL